MNSRIESFSCGFVGCISRDVCSVEGADVLGDWSARPIDGAVLFSQELKATRRVYSHPMFKQNLASRK